MDVINNAILILIFDLLYVKHPKHEPSCILRCLFASERK